MVAELGFLKIATPAAAAPDVNVVTKKTWITWKRKYEFCTRNSTVDKVGFPESLAIHLKMIGKSAMSTARRIEGSRP